MEVTEVQARVNVPETCPKDNFEQLVEKLLSNCTHEQLGYLVKELQVELEYRKFSDERIKALREKLVNEKNLIDDQIKMRKALLFSAERDEKIDEYEISYSSSMSSIESESSSSNSDSDEEEEQPKPKIQQKLKQKKMPAKKVVKKVVKPAKKQSKSNK